MKLWVDTVGRNWQVIFCWGYVFLKLWILYSKFINVRFRKLGDLTDEDLLRLETKVNSGGNVSIIKSCMGMRVQGQF